MASSSLDDFVILVVIDSSRVDADVHGEEIFISALDISSWDLPEILSYRKLRVRAHRSRLMQESSYFHGLLSGSFSESCLKHISIEWNAETFVNVLRCMYGCPPDIASKNFLPLFEAALYFGVELLLSKCKSWLSALALSKGRDSPWIELDDLINIWRFGLEHAKDAVPDLCVGYLAKNFMLVISSKLFVSVPYDLLMLCIRHPDLTIESEMYLAGALLIWLDANIKWLESSKSIQDDLIKLMEQVRFSMLPLWLIAGKRKSHGFSDFADQGIDSMFRLMKMSATGLLDLLGDGCPAHLRIRLTEHTERLDLSGCPQINGAILLLSVLPTSHYTSPMWRKSLKSFLINLGDGKRCRYELSKRTMQILSFESVQEIDISKCPRLDLKAAIKCFSKSFPSIRKLRAAYLLNFKVAAMHKLFRKFPLLHEVDLTVDLNPVILGQASVVYSSPAFIQTLPNLSSTVGSNSLDSGQSRCSLSNITRLTLEGRSDISDSDLWSISRLLDSLQYLNIKGCKLVSDACMANVIRRCKRLDSIVVCYTMFARDSCLALCTNISTGKNSMDSLASNLQMLHMSGCKGVSDALLLNLISQTQKLKSLCLRDTNILDAVLYNFSGSSLETLDISNTMISKAALALLISGNPGLKCLKTRGCRNLLQIDSSRSFDFSSSSFVQELVSGFGRRCSLEELEIGWGFSYLSLESLRPAISSLRSLSVGLGGSLGEDALRLLPSACPLLESIVLQFQAISDSTLTNITASLRHLQELALSYCFGDISILSLQSFMPNLRKLRLERVSRWMTNGDLFILTKSCPNLIELSLIGCALLNSDSQHIISSGWPGMISLHLEDCGGITDNGVSSLFGCIALEDLLLRHNGFGIQKNFILNAASKLPMLRLISLDMCDAVEGDFDVPEQKDRGFLSIIKIARCKSQRCSLDAVGFNERCRSPVHKETLVMAWNSTALTKTLVKERL